MPAIIKSKHKTLNSINAIGFIGLTALSITANAQTENLLTNPGFERGYSNWEEVEPAAISEKANRGAKSAKLNGATSKISQRVQLKPNTDYVLSAYVLGGGRIAIITSNEKKSEKRIHNADEWTKAQLEFNSGSSNSGLVYADFYRKEGKYDDFSLTEKSASSSVSRAPITRCPGSGVISIRNAFDDNSNDGNPASNTIDGNLSNRWSSKGKGKTITYDLGLVAQAKKLEVMWYKGTERLSLFSVETSIDGRKWQNVLADTVSSQTSTFDSYDIESFLSSDARFVKIIGAGNSENEWNSIVEAKVIGCVN